MVRNSEPPAPRFDVWMALRQICGYVLIGFMAWKHSVGIDFPEALYVIAGFLIGIDPAKWLARK